MYVFLGKLLEIENEKGGMKTSYTAWMRIVDYNFVHYRPLLVSLALLPCFITVTSMIQKDFLTVGVWVMTRERP